MSLDFSFKLKNYKSFKEAGIELLKIYPINVIIGKNNIGKSSFLDALDYLCEESKTPTSFGGEIEITHTLHEKFLKGHYSATTHSGKLAGNHWDDNGSILANTKARWKESEGVRELIETAILQTAEQRRFLNQTLEFMTLDSKAYRHARLLAERDIVPEIGESDVPLSSKGIGASQIVHSYLHDSQKDHRLIDRDLLGALNEIFSGDIVFSGITTKRNRFNSLWEIYLAEQTHEYFPLSESGSGLKTIILVLLNLIIRPSLEGRPLESYIFSLEEIENNLHPTLQRNLFLYLEKFAVRTGCHIFITSHSHIAIDVFCNSEHAQICHIHKTGQETIGQVFSSTAHGYRILDDLGVRASDILQSNGIIWIEGPSDRIFLNKFIELWSNGELREGAHYQFAFYGGSVLSNFDVSIPKERFEDALKVFRINKNAIFICDGDKKNTGDDHKARVAILKKKLDVKQGLLWVTDAREIENYIPKEAFEAFHKKEFKGQIPELTYIQEHINKHTGRTATEYRDKVRNATEYSIHFTLKNLEFRPELDRVMKAICAKIRLWNHL